MSVVTHTDDWIIVTSFYLGGNSVCSLDHIYPEYDTSDYC